jgi:hypothetical protein
MSIARFVRPLVVASALAMTFAVSAHAETDPDAARIALAGKSLKWNHTPQGKADRYGHAEVLINAPVAAVRNEVLKFSQYKDFSSRFRQSKVVGKDGPNTDVYLEIGAMKGWVKVYTSVRFAAPRAQGNVETIEGSIIRGREDRPSNVKDANVLWTIKKVNDNWTVLKIDLLLRPDFPAPQGPLDEELRDAAQQAVDTIHDKAQGHKNWVVFTG